MITLYAWPFGTGEVLLNGISYGNASTQYNTVAFTYEARNGSGNGNGNVSCTTGNATTRSDADLDYVAGARVDLRHRLKTIATTIDNGTPVATTTLTYCNSDTSGRSLPTSIQISDAGGNTLPATRFVWEPTTAPTNAFVATGTEPCPLSA